ncbi:hypothetical protein H010_11894 [Hydrogenophaga taeniospiralis CCUG 15921]|uniref:DUF1631 domain-containing protein n=1 Tax=Hydrogenophaga taeniospiralis CCUG 15921 TaxID=1281780 RepID=A0A9X4SFE9_9BURK|nr:DUF1631 family protein [Hydrogenophaga taeniospiralis]MDG5975961.1 hypothetical protein [Hydrogenophaga taeniospiralis CCUG 15921]
MSSPDQNVSSLAKQARELFVVQVGRALPELVKACDTRLTTILDQAGPAREMQERRDAWTAFQKNQTAWLNQSRKALQRTLLPRFSQSGHEVSTPGRLELMAEGVMDDQIMASRLAMRVLDLASTELNELRLRIQHLEKRQELPRGDVLLPDVTARILVDQWLDVHMTRESWQLVQDALAPLMAKKLLEAYKATNEFLVSSGVMKEIDLQALVKRTPGGRSATPPVPRSAAAPDAQGRAGQGPGSSPARWGPGGAATDSGRSGPPSSSHGSMSSSSMGVHDETRMMTGASPLARARMRAQGVMGRLKRMLMDKVGSDFEATQLVPPSPGLQQAMEQPLPMININAGVSNAGDAGAGVAYMDATHVEQAARVLRQRTTELKEAASTPTEKATIEVVALMFQSILAEERIPPSVRVWFARLQIPVLRVALAEPEFFSALQHPARRLIDRMGSCVLGFESNVGSAALEAEIKRVVQVIEQYPETGRRVFQLVLDEFQKFLSTYLSENGSASRFVSVAQQVEQKETLSVQYTIELRKLLDEVPVRDEVRDFLFKVWVDVLAVASVKYGLKHEETTSLKQVATDLLWAASAKPNRNDRARVIQQLPSLLQRLRQGMGLLGYPPGLQDQHIKSVSDTLADAFMSRTEPISQESLDLLSDRLANLEDYIPENGMGDLDLDNESIEMITGVDASNIEVINQGGSQPNEAMRAWAVELQIGSWFGLDHNGKLNSVQLAWRSERGQLFMFVTNGGRCFLVQSNRVAAYLQAGLLVPSEEEALTVRATRDALAKLDANPERLLG